MYIKDKPINFFFKEQEKEIKKNLKNIHITGDKNWLKKKTSLNRKRRKTAYFAKNRCFEKTLEMQKKPIV